MRNMMLKVVILGLVVFLIDFISKAVVFEYVPPMGYHSMHYPYNGIGIFQNFLGIEFSIVHLTNKGAAWGWLADFQNSLLILRIFLVMGMIVYLLFFNKESSKVFPFTLIIAGALGNVFDYFIYGHVIDMLHFVLWGYDFPSFNIADSAIFIGVSWLCLSSICNSHDSTPNKIKAY